MIRDIPRSALWLGLAGLLPMIWGVAELYLPFVGDFAQTWVSDWYLAPYGTLHYAELILCFMSGVLWGFAARGPKATAGMGYALSVLPALYTFFIVIGDASDMAIRLAIGFVLVLGLDGLFHSQKLTPEWWMRLRVLLTVGMVGCLLLIAMTEHI